MKLPNDMHFYIASTVAVMGIISTVFLYLESSDQQEQIVTLQQKQIELINTNNQKDNQLSVSSSTISELVSEIEDIKDDLDDLADDYRDEKNRNEDFEDQIRGLSGTLGDLDKLSKLDEELLQKYSKVYFLNENFIPEKLKQIRDKYVLDGKDVQFFHAHAIDPLEDMFKAAARDDIDLKVIFSLSFIRRTN